jgi:hypothetical protein
MRIVFIAGPYTGDGTPDVIERNIREAEQYAIALANLGIGFFCPHLHTAHFTSGKGAAAPEKFYYDLDMAFVEHCDALLAMPRWRESWGAPREVARAQELSRPVFFPSSPDDLDAIVEWHKKELAEKA